MVKLDEMNQIQYQCQLLLLAPIYADGGSGLEALRKRRRYLPKIRIGKSVIILIFMYNINPYSEASSMIHLQIDFLTLLVLYSESFSWCSLIQGTNVKSLGSLFSFDSYVSLPECAMVFIHLIISFSILIMHMSYTFIYVNSP